MDASTDLLTFELDGKEYKATRIRIADQGAVRDAIRTERRCAAVGCAPAVLGVLLAQPIASAEVWDYALSAAGILLLLHRCVSRVSNEFTEAMAERMVLEEHEFVNRLLIESHLINPICAETPSSTTSSPSA